MKNIHLIPTPNPSRLWMTKLGNLTRCHDINPIKEALGNNVNIYITNSEEIKEGDWFLVIGGIGLAINTYHKSHGDTPKNVWLKKIILTTDQDLIKDGVQAIDNEFLEWFIKNPSCEEVKLKDSKTVKEHSWDGSNEGEIIWEKEIIIPKEEPKQIKCYCGHTTYCDCSPLEEPKQETLEEAAEKYNSIKIAREAFIAGAKWQQKRSYSEEEVNEIIAEAWNSCEDNEGETFTEARKRILEQFKKK